MRRYDKKFFTVYGLKPIYTNWLPGEPNYDLDAENCGHYAKTKDERWAWDDGNCLKKYHFICEDKRSRRKLKCIFMLNLLRNDPGII